VHLFSRESITNLGPLFVLDVKSMMMGVWGWWAFEIFTLIASYMSTEEIAAQAVIRGIGMLTLMLPIGFGSATAMMIGHAAGAGKIQLAKQYYRVGFWFSICVSLM
jgi:multidrug resistance protein, MATE family